MGRTRFRLLTFRWAVGLRAGVNGIGRLWIGLDLGRPFLRC